MKSCEASAESFTLSAYSVSRKGGKRVLITKETVWRSNVKCVKDVRMTYVNLVITVIVFAEKKEALLSQRPSCVFV